VRHARHAGSDADELLDEQDGTTQHDCQADAGIVFLTAGMAAKEFFT